MSPMIQLTDSTYRRLQARAMPFTDTEESVIVRLLDDTEKAMRGNDSAPVVVPSFRSSLASSDGARVVDPNNPSDLSHTKVITANFGSRTGDKWNELVSIAHEEALHKLGSFDGVRSASISAISNGNRDDSGFHFQPKLGFSIQYVDANHAWKHVLALAKRLGVKVEVKFLWRDKKGAAFPGEYGALRWTPGQ
jgi:hypothetical protein